MYFNFPNILTIIRILLTPVFIYLFLLDRENGKIYAAVLFFLASLTDWYDGYLARKMNMTTRLGQFLDPVADKILISSALYLLAMQGYVFYWIVFTIIIRDVVVTTLRIYALHNGKPIITSTLAKWKTFAQMGFVMSMILYLAWPGAPDIRLTHTADDWYRLSTLAALLVTLLTTLSGVHYLIYNRTHINEIFKRITRKWLNP
ncbi:MAG TPA: CDP-diacylglycerol--glycerol-3-phosphate 3-phosphatidyltransferase [Caldithrix abyssi]|uniref:CDP-diacylglycerol--glycerol-3-phosphate 3-phosphatidyltransferase n=1 Tax=Caldithrix abyssi TaxID=187145 RepID=A0A7V1LKU7_CALAY|nr:CDP-diacylglycerol--glycerol-3-phosphate 3-phosphatidyltransferase [Caldithrix abyssi]